MPLSGAEDGFANRPPKVVGDRPARKKAVGFRGQERRTVRYSGPSSHGTNSPLSALAISYASRRIAWTLLGSAQTEISFAPDWDRSINPTSTPSTTARAVS